MTDKIGVDTHGAKEPLDYVRDELAESDYDKTINRLRMAGHYYRIVADYLDRPVYPDDDCPYDLMDEALFTAHHAPAGKLLMDLIDLSMEYAAERITAGNIKEDEYYG